MKSFVFVINDDDDSVEILVGKRTGAIVVYYTKRVCSIQHVEGLELPLGVPTSEENMREVAMMIDYLETIE